MKNLIALTGLALGLTPAFAETRTEIHCDLGLGARFVILSGHSAPGDSDLGEVTFFEKRANSPEKELFKVATRPVEIAGKKRPLALLTGTMENLHIDVDDLLAAKTADKILNGAKPKDIGIEGTELSEIQSIAFALNEKQDGGFFTITGFRNTGTGHYLTSTGPVDCVSKEHKE